MKIETFTPTTLFKPIGPYSHIAKAGALVAISGTPGVDPATGQLAGDDAYSQTRQLVRNLVVMLESVSCTIENVLHVHVYLKRVEDFEEMNRAYAEVFHQHLPARTVICVADLPKKGALLTMDLQAVCNEGAGQ